jgi:hypothetical protein
LKFILSQTITVKLLETTPLGPLVTDMAEYQNLVMVAFKFEVELLGLEWLLFTEIDLLEEQVKAVDLVVQNRFALADANGAQDLQVLFMWKL